ncbi:MAG: DUF4350 domain-containing protein [Deltaproteobacteria bacterium]|nr:DUF4350 domain-containing protein [Deltaproteobacteria bacterium]
MDRLRRYAVVGILSAGLCGACTSKEESRPPTVLFDEGHGQHFVVAGHAPLDLSGLATQFESQGLRVATGAQEIDDTILSGADVLVISGAFAPLTPAETDAIMRFVTGGGRLCVMLHIPHPLLALLERLGVVTSNGVIRERENVIDVDPMNFRVTRLAPHELTKGIDAFDVFGAWALTSSGSETVVVAKTSATSWVDLNQDRELQERDAVQSFAVTIAGRLGKGRFVVFGDDAVFQNQFFKGNNEVLGRNLAKWLTER